MEVIHHTGSDFTRIFEILHYQQAKYANSKALNEFDEQWQGYSISETIQLVEALACRLRLQGYKPGERIMLVPVLGSAARVVIDFACQLCGLVTVPVHATSRQKIFYLLQKKQKVNSALLPIKHCAKKLSLRVVATCRYFI